MKMIEVKQGNKTVYRMVDENNDQSKYEPRTGKDLTTSGAKSICMDMTEEQYKSIFVRKNEN
jgi:hypothetical protein